MFRVHQIVHSLQRSVGAQQVPRHKGLQVLVELKELEVVEHGLLQGFGAVLQKAHFLRFERAVEVDFAEAEREFLLRCVGLCFPVSRLLQLKFKLRNAQLDTASHVDQVLLRKRSFDHARRFPDLGEAQLLEQVDSFTFRK